MRSMPCAVDDMDRCRRHRIGEDRRRKHAVAVLSGSFPVQVYCLPDFAEPLLNMKMPFRNRNRKHAVAVLSSRFLVQIYDLPDFAEPLLRIKTLFFICTTGV